MGNLAKGRLEFYYFSGDEEMNTLLDNTAIVDVTSTYPGIGDGIVDITMTDHGFKAPAQFDRPTHIFIQGTTNYNGLRRIHSAPDANSLFIFGKYVAETPAGTEIARPGLQFDEDWLFMGFKLHLDAASATTENFVINIDSDMGAAWDYNIYTSDMNGVQDLADLSFMDEPVPLKAKDIVYCTWANTNDKLWGLEILAQRLD